MTEAAIMPHFEAPSLADRILKASTIFWFLVTAIGQWAFIYYIIANYGGAALAGDLEKLQNSAIHGYTPGDLAGNLFFGGHMIMAVILTFGGLLQLVPQIRARAASFHRWNGRIFIVTALALALGGFYLIWVRQSYLSIYGAISITMNGILIIVFAVTTLRYAMARKIAQHQRWALRTFMVVNGVWFFRVGFMAWILINQGAVGSNDTLTGPFDKFWAYANFLLPLAILELYLHVQDGGGPSAKMAMATLLFVLTCLIGVGIFAATMFMWLPRL